MGRKCCVPLCNSNYNNTKEYVTVFFFPKDPIRREKWKQMINRENFEPSSESVVCIKHFSSQFFVQGKIKRRSTNTISDRVKPKLTEDAYPTIFPRSSRKRKSAVNEDYFYGEINNQDKSIVCHEDRKDNIVFDHFLLENQIDSFDDLCIGYKSKDFSPFIDVLSSNSLLFIKLKPGDFEDNCPEIKLSINVNINLQVKIYCNGKPLNTKQYSSLLENELRLTRWSQFDSLFNYFKDFDSDDRDLSELLEETIESIKIVKDSMVHSDIILAKRLRFIEEQLSLSATRSPKYSPFLLLWASSLFFNNPLVYADIRKTQILCLPHPEHLKSLFFSKETLNITSHIEYLKRKCTAVKPHERIVNVLLDEIQLKSPLSEGVDTDRFTSNFSEATTIQAFMLNSALSSHKDVIGLFPVKSLNSEKLFQCTKLVIKMLTKAGFRIISIIAENNEVNTEMFKIFCPNSKIENSFTNPFEPTQDIFIIFDTVHLLKCIRNEWINQKDDSKTFLIPSLEYNEDTSFRICHPNLDITGDLETTSHLNFKAQFSDLRGLYLCDQLNSLLSRNILFPSSFEKDNIFLILKLIDDKVISALKTIPTTVVSPGTITFLEIIKNWWQCISEKHHSKGIRIKQEFSDYNNWEPLVFLESFSNWLSVWDSIHCSGKLSTETFFSLKHTTDSLLILSKVLLSMEEFDSVLLGQFQIDPLELRFAHNQQINRTDPLYDQVLQYELELHDKFILQFKSSTMGDFEIKEFFTDNFTSDDDKVEIFDDQFLDDVVNQCDSIEISPQNSIALLYIAGYVGSKTGKIANCPGCLNLLCNKADMSGVNTEDFKPYLQDFDLDELKYPSGKVFTIAIIVYQVFQTVLTSDFEKRFLSCKNQKKIIITSVNDLIDYNNIDFVKTCPCNNSLDILILNVINSTVNILLNNYVYLYPKKVEKLKKQTDKRKYTESFVHF